MTQSITQKHLEMFFDTKLDFLEHLKSIFNKVLQDSWFITEAPTHIVNRNNLKVWHCWPSPCNFIKKETRSSVMPSQTIITGLTIDA